MKKTAFYSTILIAILSCLSACEKEYTCVCTDGVDTKRINIAKSTRSEAQDVCSEWDAYWSLSAGSCSLN